VVVPLSTLPNWEREFATWAPHLNVVVLHGNQSARDLIKKHELFAPGVKNIDLQVNYLYGQDHSELIPYTSRFQNIALSPRLQDLH